MAGPLILRPAPTEVRAMLQKIKMDNRERSRRLAGLVNSCPSYPNPSATTTTTTTSELIGQSPAFDQATTTAAILRPATLEKWVSLDYTHTWHTIQFSGGTTGTRNLIFFWGVVTWKNHEIAHIEEKPNSKHVFLLISSWQLHLPAETQVFGTCSTTQLRCFLGYVIFHH